MTTATATAAIGNRTMEAVDRPRRSLEELVDRLLAGENPVRAWREYRGLTGVELAAAAGVAASYLSAIENRKKPGSINALKRLATALRVDVDDLI